MIITIKNRIDDSFDRLGKAEYLNSSIDLQSGYHQILVTEEGRERENRFPLSYRSL